MDQIAVISDIHGHLTALETVLSDIENEGSAGSSVWEILLPREHIQRSVLSSSGKSVKSPFRETVMMCFLPGLTLPANLSFRSDGSNGIRKNFRKSPWHIFTAFRLHMNSI